jgi:predicted RNA-binding Zn ribbon-like protein
MQEPEFTLLGDAIWLDFVNTAKGRTPSPPDLLPDEPAILRWTLAQSLGHFANIDPPTLSTALRFRERLTQMAEALHSGLRPPAGSIAAINDQLALAGGCHQLTRVGGEWQLRFAPSQPLGILAAIAHSAGASLADPLLFIRQCAGESCSLFFSDDSPNQSRRWCNAAVCGREVRIERRRGLLR